MPAEFAMSSIPCPERYESTNSNSVSGGGTDNAKMSPATTTTTSPNESVHHQPLNINGASGNSDSNAQQPPPSLQLNGHVTSNSNGTTTIRIESSDARQDVAAPNTSDVITILHFNDCYNIEPREGGIEPAGGAARFCAALKSFADCDPLVLFSGDILGPSILSTFTKGEQMVPVLNQVGVHCAVYGNHDFDYGVDNLIDIAQKCTFPWLMSNVVDNETGSPLGDGRTFHVLHKADKKIGLIGLIEEEWLATLATIDREDVTYYDFVSEGRKLAKYLREKEKVDYVIALTHMRTPNDCRLADNVDEIDLILGGHDHDYEVIRRLNGKYIIKSGTDFREFSKIDISFPLNNNNNNNNNTSGGSKGHAEISIRHVEVRSDDFPHEDETLAAELHKFSSVVEAKMDTVLGEFHTDVDGRFASIRTKETNLGNFVTDIMLASTHSDAAILNSGTLRSDTLHKEGQFKLRDLVNILPMMDPMIVLSASGRHIWKALENGVCQWPKLEGRFPQVSGLTFAFDPALEPGSRINPDHIKIGDEYLDLDARYRLVTKAYLHQGKDGYDCLKTCPVLVQEEDCPELTTSIVNHFEAIKIVKNNSATHHRQSLVCVSRRTSVVKQYDVSPVEFVPDASLPAGVGGGSHGPSSGSGGSSGPMSLGRAPPKRGMSLDGLGTATLRRSLSSAARAMSVDEVEMTQCRLEPKVEGRIRVLTPEVLQEITRERAEYERLASERIIIEEEPESESVSSP